MATYALGLGVALSLLHAIAAWPAMDTYGHLWTPVDTYGHLWTPMNTYGHLCTRSVCRNEAVTRRRRLDTYGHLWTPMAVTRLDTYDRYERRTLAVTRLDTYGHLWPLHA